MKSILPFTEKHEEFRLKFRAFVEKEMVPHYEEWQQKRSVPRELFKKMGEQGYLCTWADKKYGGKGLDFLYQIVILQETSKHGLGCIGQWLHSDIVSPYIDAFGSEELKSKYIPQFVSGEKMICVAMTEPNAGSDLVSMQSTAIKNGDHYILGAEVDKV